MKAFYNIKPLENAYLLNSGEVAVCINWIEKTVDIKGRKIDGYECTQLNIPVKLLEPNYVIEKFVREFYSQSEEFALINAYQSSLLGIYKDSEKETEYCNFLEWRISMKKQVKEAISSFTLLQTNKE